MQPILGRGNDPLMPLKPPHRPVRPETNQDEDRPPVYTETASTADYAPSRRESRMSTSPTLDVRHRPTIDTSLASPTSFLSPTVESPYTPGFPRRMSFTSGSVITPMTPLTTTGLSPPGPVVNPTFRPRRPTEPIDYVFKPLSFDSMGLIQSGGSPEGVMPQYHISVRVNCFTPSFWITTIRRGGSENSEYVGEFEMGYSNMKPSTLVIRGREYKIRNVFKVNFSDYTWATPGRGLLWDKSVRKHSMTVFTCSAIGRTAVYAKFFPANESREPGQTAAVTRLVVYPDGYELFDDILMSALILERVRTGGTLS